MMSGWVLDDQALVSYDAFKNMGLFDFPGANVGKFLFGLRVLFLSVRGCPARLPVIGKLLEERCLEVGRLQASLANVVWATRYEQSS